MKGAYSNYKLSLKDKKASWKKSSAHTAEIMTCGRTQKIWSRDSKGMIVQGSTASRNRG